LNTDMCKFELSQKDESRAQSADSSKAYSKLRAYRTKASLQSSETKEDP